jgi:phage regulator Rha-like protein
VSEIEESSEDNMQKRELDKDLFIEMYMSDMRYYDICEAFGISLDTLRKRIKEYGLPRRRPPVTVDLEAFKNAYYSDVSSYKLAEKFGICRSTVTRLVKELKLRENINVLHRTECYAEI